MPDSTNLPAWGRIPIRLICTLQYLMLAVLVGHAAVDPPHAIAALVGGMWASSVATLTAIAFLLAAGAHGLHRWMVERAVLPFAISGLILLDGMLWTAVPIHKADPDSALLVLIVVLGLVVRFLGLEVFAHQHRPTWRRDADG